VSTDEASRARVHVSIRGRVQRVFFRASAEVEARRHGLSGWVRNCADGSVELLAEGSREALDALLAWCAHGPPRAAVEDVDATWQEYRGEFDDFSVR